MGAIEAEVGRAGNSSDGRGQTPNAFSMMSIKRARCQGWQRAHHPRIGIESAFLGALLAAALVTLIVLVVLAALLSALLATLLATLLAALALLLA